MLAHALRGVSDGIVTGTPEALPPLAAVSAGRLPASSGLLPTTLLGTADDCVATDDAEFDLVGDEGRWETGGAVAGGDEAVNELAELRCW